MNIWESLAQVDGRKSLERRVGGSFEKKREKKEKRMAVDLIELRVREVSNDFVVRYGSLWGGGILCFKSNYYDLDEYRLFNELFFSRGRKLVYIGEPGLESDGFAQLADRFVKENCNLK